MEPEENIVDAPPHEPGRGCYKANLVLNTFVALGLGMTIVLILNIFNRSGDFALLSGLFGALLYCAIVFPRILFGPTSVQRRRNHAARNNDIGHEEQGDRHIAKSTAFGGLAISTILALAACIGLHYLPANQPIFALVAAILAIAICVALFIMGLSILILFLGRGRAENNGVYIDF